MIRLGRALKHSTTYAYTFVSIIALGACASSNEGDEESGGAPPPAYDNSQNPASTAANGDGVTPVGTGSGSPVGTTPSGDTSGEIPLTPPADTGDGNGSTTPTSTTEPPAPTTTSTTEPPAPTTTSTAEPPPAQPPTFTEFSGTGCAIPQFPGADALATNNLLPDPFTKLDGTRMTTRAEWRCRRAEIKELAEQYIYGDKPGRPQTVTGTVSNTNITVNVSNQGRNASFSVSVQLPTTGTAPYPALISFGGFAHNTLVRNEGVAIINVTPNTLGNEGSPRSAKSGVFYTLYGAQSFTGALLAWSWGVSRIIDVIEQSGGDVIKADALAVAGCSRNGKGAFTIGAFDERIALTIPFESGSGGVPIWRGIPGEGAQSPSSAYGETYWLGDAFGAFIGNGGVNRLPVDTHEIVAMIAPRGLLILDNPHIANLGPESAHVAALGGAEVFRALGAGANISYHSAVQDGTHCAARTEHQEPLRQALRKFLLKTGNTNGAITAAASTTGNLGQWRNWTTPTLN